MLAAPVSRLVSSQPAHAYIALTGNPNCGKTTIFNALTGLRAKVGNYAGVTVERKEGRMLGDTPERRITILDLPGTYSLSPKSLDEQISRDVLFHRLTEVPPPSLVLVVVDASNLERNLYYATQVIELGYPTIIALNMMDVAATMGWRIDAAQLSRRLGVPVIPLVARAGEGIPALRSKILEMAFLARERPVKSRFCEMSPAMQFEVERLSRIVESTWPNRTTSAYSEAVLLLTDEKMLSSNGVRIPEIIPSQVSAARSRLEAEGEDWRSAAIEARYATVNAIHQQVAAATAAQAETLSDHLDRILTHKFWGMLIFVAVMALMFESIFSLARYPMDGLQFGVTHFGEWVGHWIPPGDLHSLLIDGVIAGVGAVVVFLPQICLLFFFIGLLEDTGYMARAAFLMDRLMSKVGLHGKSFIPMLSSFACAIPGIMATRTIESPKDRLVTILVAPLMSCSARLPVYTLLIAACIPDRRVFGIFTLAGVTMLAMYLLGTVVALLMAWLFKRTLLRGETPVLIMELPPYRVPVVAVVVRHMWDRSKLFLRRAGTVILGISILLWFLATYPRSTALERRFEIQKASLSAVEGPSRSTIKEEQKAKQLADLEKQHAGEVLRQSFAGRMGQAIEPVLAPLGFDWKIGIGIVASFAAREVFVSTMSTVYNVGGEDDSKQGVQTVAKALRDQQRADGSPLFTPLLAVSLMVFYVFALQCVSTVAVVRRETNSWKWPLFQWAYMGVLAWTLAFITYQGGRLLGFH